MNLRRSALFWVLAAWLLAAGSVSAQVGAKVARIGFLSAGAEPGEADWRQRSVQHEALRRLGWREGENLLTEWRWANGQLDKLPSLAAELVALKVDVIVASAFKPGQVASQATQVIPVVLITCDPYQMLVGSLARPGGNVTGQTCMSAELSPKKLQLLKEAVPGTARVAFLYNPDDPGPRLALTLCRDAAADLGIRLQSFAIQRAEDITALLASIGSENVDALFVYPDAVTAQARPEIVQFAARRRLPTVGGFKAWAETGFLLSYGASLPDMTRRAMVQVDRILREGAKPGDIPIEQPTTFELVVNLRTAKALGLTIPPSLLLRADEVIE